MAGLGLGITFLGYWVFYYGVTQVQGGNWGFLDLGLPSRADVLSGIPMDSGTTKHGSKSTQQLIQEAKAGKNSAIGPLGGKPLKPAKTFLDGTAAVSP